MSAFATPLRDVTLVEASAGTGKTHTLGNLFLRLLLEAGHTPAQILVVTFTNAATAELKERLRNRLREASDVMMGGLSPRDPELGAWLAARVAAGHAPSDLMRLGSALRDFDQAAIFTIHGFCQRVLTDHALLLGTPSDLDLLPDPGPLLDEIAHDYWVERLHNAPPAVVGMLRAAKIVPDGPGGLRALARIVVGDPQLPILTQDHPPEVVDVAMRIETALGAARSAWPGGAAYLAFLEPLGLHGNIYRKTSVPQWMDLCDELFAPATNRWPNPKDHGTILDKLSFPTLCNHAKRPVPGHPFALALGPLLEALTEVPAAVQGFRLRFIDYARKEAAARKTRARLMTYDDFLHGVARALHGPQGPALVTLLRRSYPAALIDEFQDTDPLQYDFFRQLYVGTGAPLFLIGDPKQAIYSFRGADIFAYLNARSDASQTLSLQVNRRSVPELVQAQNAVFASKTHPFLFDAIPFPPACALPQIGRAARAPLRFLLSQDKDRAAGLATHLVAALNAGRAPRDVAILCRTNVQAMEIQTALQTRGVPTVLLGDKSVLDSEEAQELFRVLLATAEPGRRGLVRAALTTTLLGVDAQTLHAFKEADENAVPNAHSAPWELWVERLRGWRALWEERGLPSAFARILEDTSAVPRLLSMTEGLRVLTNLRHLVELLHAEAVRSHLQPTGVLSWFGLVLADEDVRRESVGEAAQIRLETDEDAVQLTTIHKSKGLEYPIVILPSADHMPRKNDAPWLRVHDPAQDDRMVLDLGREDGGRAERLAREQAERLSEDLRLLYVALTRAKEETWIAWGKDGLHQSALGLLLHHPADAPFDPQHLDDMRKRTSARLKEPNALLLDLAALAERSSGHVSQEPLSVANELRFVPRSTPRELTPARIAQGPFDLVLTTSSFTSLIRHAAPHDESPVTPPGADDDTSEALELQSESPEPTVVPQSLGGLPPGAATGTLVHDLLERIAFDSSPAAMRPEIERALRQGGLPDTQTDGLAAALGRCLAAPLSPLPIALKDLAPQDCVRELEFTFPVGAPLARLSPHSLAEALAQGEPALPDTVAITRQLGFADLSGFLRGFVDLVFRHDGRYYVVDYKTNSLGGDYGPKALAACMTHDHYQLQLHLYVVALHRHLRARLRGYSPTTHLGGAFYLFLRGMDARPGSGVYFVRPDAKRLDALDRALGAHP